MIPGYVVFDECGCAVWHRPDGVIVPLDPQGNKVDWARRIMRGVLVDRDRRPQGVVEQACLALGLPVVRAKGGR